MRQIWTAVYFYFFYCYHSWWIKDYQLAKVPHPSFYAFLGISAGITLFNIADVQICTEEKSADQESQSNEQSMDPYSKTKFLLKVCGKKMEI